MISFYLGGLVATGIITLSQAIDDDEPLDAAVVLAVLLWPMTVAGYAYAVARARWP